MLVEYSCWWSIHVGGVFMLAEYSESMAGRVENYLEPIAFTIRIFMPILLSHFDELKMSGCPGITSLSLSLSFSAG